MRLLKVLILPESTAQSPSKRRRNVCYVWTSIDKANRKCKVEKYSARIGVNLVKNYQKLVLFKYR